ncbi:uncharacterized protein VDAG_06604 [Verticillium dahliae VdLs.17]|uniref:Fun14 family protein n=1 Tax=Verticillium dahliae (strain VdLs.17 / ATCC MYA-4575 / FGSC 10137) TaxID=498257 RepID=G2X8X2_VERDV|nr:uncharacterized protein VDAG_06604 [Verticillium dahliae VdLs.17]EGY15440.1 hypothetical protein VDAG_06604 [Verticillium dahliae VdLs.17]KAH6687509.1 hypothetical protein EV126DRAFT_349523 [Verticillium dahliae]
MHRFPVTPFRWRLPLQAGTGLGLTYSLQCRRAFRLDSQNKLTTSSNNKRTPPSHSTRGTLNADFVRDCSRGSMAGFGAGLVVGFFSQAIVFVSGLAMLTLHVSLLWERKRIPDVIYSIKTKHCRSYTDGGLIFPSCSG